MNIHLIPVYINNKPIYRI